MSARYNENKQVSGVSCIIFMIAIGGFTVAQFLFSSNENNFNKNEYDYDYNWPNDEPRTEPNENLSSNEIKMISDNADDCDYGYDKIINHIITIAVNTTVDDMINSIVNSAMNKQFDDQISNKTSDANIHEPIEKTSSSAEINNDYDSYVNVETDKINVFEDWTLT